MYSEIYKYIPLTLKIFFVYSSFMLFSGCNKLVDIDPPKNDLTGQTLFTTDATATAAVTGIYAKMLSDAFGFCNGGMTLFGGLSADELVNYSTSTAQGQVYAASITPSNQVVSRLWGQAYFSIYQANAVLEGLANSTGVSDDLKKQLLGEAKFIRAFCHLNLVNLYGDIPLVLTTDYRENATAAKTTKDKVLQQVVTDLREAANLMTEDYHFSNGEKVRPTKWAALALLSRTFLYMGNWKDAEMNADILITSGRFTLLSDMTKVFLANSDEAIWQLMPISPGGINTTEGSTFILTTVPNNAVLTDELVNTFEPGDGRKDAWIGSFTSGTQTFYFPYKYKVKASTTLSEYYMVLRLAEQLLIRAEARIQQNNLNSGLEDLNLLRARAGLAALAISDQASALNAVYQERRVELFAEWGHRWIDLKRTGLAESVLSTIKTGWLPTDALYPVPQSEINKDPMLTQNPGY